MKTINMYGTLLVVLFLLPLSASAQKNTVSFSRPLINPALYQGLKWRNIGPFRGGRSVAVAGVAQDPLIYYMGTTGGGIWKTEDAGLTWQNISDGFFNSGSVGALAVAPSDPNIIYAGMGEHAVRGVMTSHGDGIYRSVDAGKTWSYLGLPDSRHIAEIQIHPHNPDLVYVAVQGSAYGPNEQRGVYQTTDGGQTWRKLLYTNNQTGACDLSLDNRNPRVLFAAMWDHHRLPWKVRSGGPGSGIYKSVDGGETWEKLTRGLPEKMGKAAVAVSPANPEVVYANIEAENGGVFRSDDGGMTWRQTSKDRTTMARAWYYIEIFPDPLDVETVYVLNAPMLKSIDGGKTFQIIDTPHSDQHDLWINPTRPENMILANDGGACITFTGGTSWSSQFNQPTGQFYRIIADHRFPYFLYSGQQDNSTIAIPSRTNHEGIGVQDWYPVAGCESAFLAFDPGNPEWIYGGCYQGYIEVYNHHTRESRDIMAYPAIGLGSFPKDMKFRFNWNAPIVAQPQNPQIIYHAGNKVLKTSDGGSHWQEISPDLTRNEEQKQGPGGEPFTNEGAGGEIYNTISYLACSPHQAGIIWAGSDDGLVHLTLDEGKTWTEVTPPGMGEALINCIEVSPHRPEAAYIVATRYKLDDFTPLIFFTSDFGKTWSLITEGIAREDFVRVVREDPVRQGMLYGGTEKGLYISFNNGKEWHRFPFNLPVCPVTDLTIQDNDLIASTMGRGIWILDDLGALQQSMGRLPDEKPMVFQPKPAYRMGVNYSNQPVSGSGQNPPPGMIIDYYLPSDMDSMPVMLQILDRQHFPVRTYNNRKTNDYSLYDGGPPPPAVLPSGKGLHRFFWDLRRDPIPAVPDVFVYGGYNGSMVAPGDFTIRLITPADTLEQSCTVLADPRIQALQEAYAAQQQLLLQIEEAISSVHSAVIQMREVKLQIKDVVAKLEKMDNAHELAQKGKYIQQTILDWEEALIQPRQKTYQDVINFSHRLSSELIDLKNRIDSNDPRPTQGARQRLKDLLAEWKEHQDRMNRILENDIAAFNQSFQEKRIPAVIVPEVDKKP